MIKIIRKVDNSAIGAYCGRAKMRAECAGCGSKIKKSMDRFRTKGNFCDECCGKMRNKDLGGYSITKIIYKG